MPVVQELNLHERRWCLSSKLYISLLLLTSSTELQIGSFHIVLLKRTAKEWTKMQNARVGLAEPLFLLIKLIDFWQNGGPIF